ncbi:hypothetical protein NNX39_13685 [Arthrobacter sp. zg-Y826]|uniref:hypothetical protein n=1 Tax=Arthrobacter jinronghuae TaxID=2964609 RepID=UPI0021079B0B|nr:hypothetical protein [Arthrobacter jinronghuae]MCQ1957548.1 hypothetical protein [Arthrobacter jinronghuae]
MKSKHRNRAGTGTLIIGLGFLIATTVLLVKLHVGPAWPIAATLLAGLVFGFCLLRFPYRTWVTPVLFVLFFGAFFVLPTDELRIAWFGGYAAGGNFGKGWKEAAKQSWTQKWAWTVDQRGFDSVVEAREAAGTALRALDGKAQGRLDVGHGSASFQVTGGVETGLVCHRTADASNNRVGAWAALVRAGHTLDGAESEWADVPLGEVTGLVPVPLINDLDSVEWALDDFFRNPQAAPAGSVWATGNEAEDLRLAPPR